MPFIPHTPADVEQMLAAIGAKKIDDLFDEIPKDLRVESLAGIPDALNEMQVGRLMSARVSRPERGANKRATPAPISAPRRKSLTPPLCFSMTI